VWLQPAGGRVFGLRLHAGGAARGSSRDVAGGRGRAPSPGGHL